MSKKIFRKRPSGQAAQETLAVKVITPINSVLELAAIEAAMQGLPLDERHPVSLELAGTAAEQMWIVRGTNAATIEHAERQLRARYPQIAFVAFEGQQDDPFRLDAGETVSVIELDPGAPSYVPMNPWDPKMLDKVGTDPLLGVCAAIEHLPDDLRAVAQVAIVPAAVNWAGPLGQRKAVEHPLEQEREEKRASMYAERGGHFSWTTIIGLASILFGLYLFRTLHITLPAWALSALSSLLHGHLPHLFGTLSIQFYGGIGLLLVCLFLLYVFIDQARKRFKRTRVVDPRVVSQKTGQTACRVRLRLYVIGPGPRRDLVAYCRTQLAGLLVLTWSASGLALWKRIKRPLDPLGRAARHPLRTLRAAWPRLRWGLRHPRPALRTIRRGAYRWVSASWGRTRPQRGFLWWALRHPPTALRGAWSGIVRLPRRVMGSQFVAILRETRQTVGEERAYRRTQAERRNAVQMRMTAAYRQFHRGGGGYFVPRRLSTRAGCRIVRRGKRWRFLHDGWQRGVRRSTHYWSMEDLASAWHLLQAHDLPHVALVASRSARSLPIPPDVARLSQGQPVIGHAQHGEFKIPFAFTREWLRLHGLIAGKSGEGKTNLLLHIAEAAMQAGEGLIFIDLPGDSIPAVLQRVPPRRGKDVVVIDLSDPRASVGINPLDVTLGRGRDKSIADMLEVLSHIWMRSWGSRMENSFEFGLRTEWEANRHFCRVDSQFGPRQQYTLLDLLPLYTNRSFCNSVLQYVTDPYIHRWWTEFFWPLDLRFQRDIITPVATKVAKFESEIARRIVGQPKSTINLTEIIQGKKILLVRLAKGMVGADAAPLLGATILGLLSMCLQEQGAIAEEQRAQFPILIDEFQALEGVDWSILAELRKYGATFFLATQSLEYLAKLEATLLPTVVANVRQIYCFNLSAQDAWTIHRELGVEAQDIVNLDSHMCYVRLKQGEQRRPTFSLNIAPPPSISEEQVRQAEDIMAASRRTYATPGDKVDEWLRDAVVRQQHPEVGIVIDADIEAGVVAQDGQAREALPAVEEGSLASDGKTHSPRARGGANKSALDQKNQRGGKPQVSSTPAGRPRSAPILFGSRRSPQEKGKRRKGDG